MDGKYIDQRNDWFEIGTLVGSNVNVKKLSNDKMQEEGFLNSSTLYKRKARKVGCAKKTHEGGSKTSRG